MNFLVKAIVAFTLMANFTSCDTEDDFPRHYIRDRRDHSPYSFDANAQPFHSHHEEYSRKSRQSRQSSRKNNFSSSNKEPKHSNYGKSDPCADPAYKDAPFCQKPIFLRAGQAIPIFWKNRDIAVSPISNTVGGSIQLRTYDANNQDQKWIFTPVSEFSYNNKYFITNASSKLALTANAYPSPLILQNLINAVNQIFYVRPQTDGSFFVSAYGSDLYMDAQEVNSGSLPVLIIRNYEGDITQKWLLN